MRQIAEFLCDNARWLGSAFILTFFSTIGQTSFIGGSAGHIRQEYGLSNGQWGLIFMAGTLASALTLPYLGAFVDRYPLRRIVLFIAPLLAVAAVLMAVSTHVALLVLAIYLLRLAGQGMFPHMAYTSTARWFTGQRGKALALVILGHNLGEAVLITGFAAFAVGFGWRPGWLLLAAAIVLIALPLVVTLASRERIPSAAEVNPRVVDARDWTRAEVLRDPIFYLSLLGIMAPAFMVTVAFFHQVYLAELRGWPVGLFASAFIVWAIVNSGFTLLSGYLIDRISALSLFPIVLLPLGAACIVLGSVEAQWAPFAFMVLVAMSSGMATTMFGAVIPEVYGLKHIGSIRALIVSTTVFASAAGPGITGLLIDRGVSYPGQLIAMGLYCFPVSLLLVWVVRKVRMRNLQSVIGQTTPLS
jgi:MFS family permease